MKKVVDTVEGIPGPSQLSQSSQSSGAKTGAKRKRSRIVQNESDSDN